MDYNIIIAACITLAFIFIFFIKHEDSYKSEKMIQGFWVVSDQFKEQAKIDQMILYFGEGNGYIYKGFLSLVVDNVSVFNDHLDFRIIPKGYFREGYTLEIEKQIEYIPNKLIMNLDPCNGMMELKCSEDNKIYARMFKDNQMSAKTILNIDESKEESDDEPSDDE